MKQPRIHDFDPDAKPSPQLGSPMDNMPSILKPQKSAQSVEQVVGNQETHTSGSPEVQKLRNPEIKKSSPSPTKQSEEKIIHEKVSPPSKHSDTVIPRHHDTMQPSNRDTTTPSNHDTTIPVYSEDIIETVRKAVKQIGKEAATYRFTLEEKQFLEDVKYTYKRQGILTSEVEITRIAINYFVQDYRKNGEQSMLAKILKHLNS